MADPGGSLGPDMAMMKMLLSGKHTTAKKLAFNLAEPK